MNSQQRSKQRQNEDQDFKRKYEELLAKSNAEKEQWRQTEQSYQEHINVLQRFIEQSDLSQSFHEHMVRHSIPHDFSRMSSTRSMNVVNKQSSLNFNQSEIQAISSPEVKSPNDESHKTMIFRQESDVEAISEGLNEGLHRSKTVFEDHHGHAENFEVIAETNSLDDESSINENSRVVDRGNIQNQSIISLTSLMQQMNPGKQGGIHMKSPSGSSSQQLKAKQKKLAVNRPQTAQENPMMKLAVKSQIPKTPKKLAPKEKNPHGRNYNQMTARDIHQTTSKIAGKSALSSYKIQKPYSSRPASGQSHQHIARQQSEKVKADQMNSSRSIYDQFIETTSNIIRKQPSHGQNSKNESTSSFNFLGLGKQQNQNDMLTPMKDKTQKKAKTDAQKRRIQQSKAIKGMMDFTNAGLTIDESNKSQSQSPSPERNPLNSFFTQIVSPSRDSKIKRNNFINNLRKQNLSQILKPNSVNLLRPPTVTNQLDDNQENRVGYPTAQVSTHRPSPNLPVQDAVQIKKFDSDEIPDIGQIKSKNQQFVSQTTVRASQVEPEKKIPIQEFDIFENTNQMFGMKEHESSSIIFEEGDENVRDSVIKSPNLENFSSFVKNNQQRFSTEATFGRRKPMQKTDQLVVKQATLEKSKIEENKNENFSDNSDDDLDREEVETTKLQKDLDNFEEIENLGNQNDSDVESSKSVDQQLKAANQKKDIKNGDSFSKRNSLQYFSKSEVQTKERGLEPGKHQKDKKIVINLPSLRQKLAQSHASDKEGKKSDEHEQNKNEEEGFIEQIQQRKRGFTVLETRQDQNDNSSNVDKKNYMSRSHKGKSVQGGTLNLGKTTDAFNQEEGPGYLDELMGSIVGQLKIRKTFKRITQHGPESVYQQIHSNFKSQKNMKFGIHNSMPRMDIKRQRQRDFDSNEEREQSQQAVENTQSQGHDLGLDEMSQFRSSGISIDTNLDRKKGLRKNRVSLTSIKSITEDEESQIPINSINMDNSQIIPFDKVDKSQFVKNNINMETQMDHIPRMSTLEKVGQNSLHDQLKQRSSRNVKVIPKAATKGTDFQSSLKARENIEWEEDALRRTGKPGELNHTQPIQSITTQRIFTQKNKSIVELAHSPRLPPEEVDQFDALGNYDLQMQARNASANAVYGAKTLQVPEILKEDGNSYEDFDEVRVNEDPSFRDQNLHNTILTTQNYPSKYGKNQGNYSVVQPNMSVIDPEAANFENRRSDIEKYNAQIHCSVQQKIMEFARFRKSKPQRLFEQFYVVGVKPQGLDKIVSSFDEQDCESPNIFDRQFLRGQMLYKYPQQAEMKQIEVRSKVINDWVFPDGVDYAQVGDLQSREAKDILNEMLYEIPNNRRNTFMFTLDANIDEKEDESLDPLSPTDLNDVDAQEHGTGNYFNCLCVKYFVLVQRHKDGQIFKVEQAFCMISRNNFFQAQYDAIDKLLQVINMNQKLNQIQNQSQIADSQEIESPDDSILAQNFFIVDYTDPDTYVSIHEIYGIQLQYQELLSSKHDPFVSLFPLSMKIKTNILIRAKQMADQESLQIPYEYQFPPSVKECYALDFTWHVPIVLQVFQDLRIIMRLLTALLLEKSIVFVSSDSAKLTSVILGLKSLMKPFDWSFTLAPNLPAAMQGILESPLPMLVGISRELLYTIREEDSMDQESIESKTWVFLDRDAGPLSFNLTYDNLQSPLWQQDAGIAWCLTEQDQVKMESYLWYREYPEFDKLMKIHQDFRNCRATNLDQTGQMDDEDSLFEVSDKQMGHLQKFYDAFNEMIFSQIVDHINLNELQEQNRLFNLRNQEVDNSSQDSSNKISDVQKLEIFKQMVLDKCNTLDAEFKDEITHLNFGSQSNKLTKHQNINSRNRMQASNTTGPSLAVMKRISVLQTRQLTKNHDVESVDRQIQEMPGSSQEIVPFLEELVQTTAFQQMLNDLIKRKR